MGASVDRWGDVLDVINGVCLGIFLVELALRLASYWPRPLAFFRNGWNVFDFVVILAVFVPGIRQNSTLLRLLRLLRVVRIVRVLPDLRVLLLGVWRSVPPLASIGAVTAMILFVYGMVGWIWFGDELPDEWGNIGRAMLTLFVMLTLENFPVYMDEAMEVEPWAWLYFVSFILVAAFIVLNVLIGVVLNSMEEAREHERGATRFGSATASRGRHRSIRRHTHPSPSGSRSSAAPSTSSSWSSQSGPGGDARPRALGLRRGRLGQSMQAVCGHRLALALHPHRRHRLDDRLCAELAERRLVDEHAADRRGRLEPCGQVDDVADDAVLAVAARCSDDGRVHLAARHAGAEARPVVVVGRGPLRDALEDEGRPGGPQRVIRDRSRPSRRSP